MGFDFKWYCCIKYKIYLKKIQLIISNELHYIMKSMFYFNNEWCPDAESNHGHRDFQSLALPTELSGLNFGGSDETRTRDILRDRQAL